MNQHHGDNHVDEAALERGHEVQETNVRLVVKFGIGLTILTVVSMLLMWGLFVVVEDYNASSFTPPALTAEKDQKPPEPRLQVIPEEDLAKLRAAEQKKLDSYGWVIRTADIVRIPVDRALQLTADESRFKLPARSQSEQTTQE
jgi:hypothetical protein